MKIHFQVERRCEYRKHIKRNERFRLSLGSVKYTSNRMKCKKTRGWGGGSEVKRYDELGGYQTYPWTIIVCPEA